MYCSQCGAETPERRRSCKHCGGSLSARAGPSPSTAPQLTVRPVFVPVLSLAWAIPFALFLSLWVGGFLGGFSALAIEALDFSFPKWLPFVLSGGIALVGIPLLFFGIHRKTYRRIEYRVFLDRLEYYEGFFTVEERSVALEDVTEVTLRKGVLQSRYGLGTLILATRATSSSASAGIRIADIEDPDEVYRSLKHLIGRARRSTVPAPPQAA